MTQKTIMKDTPNHKIWTQSINGHEVKFMKKLGLNGQWKHGFKLAGNEPVNEEVNGGEPTEEETIQFLLRVSNI